MGASEFETILEQLTGERTPFPDAANDKLLDFDIGPSGLGYSQLNELLLLFGLDRVTHAFFAYLATGSTVYEPGDGFASLEDLKNGVERFRRDALLLFGNVKFAFKSLSRDVERLELHLGELQPLDPSDFSKRHTPILPVAPIAPEDAYLTGYLVEAEIKKRLALNPQDPANLAEEAKRQSVVQQGIRNHVAYLASDHLDVYVATSMRARHEFLAINRLAKKIFEDDAVAPLKLRWFDPTQAYCANRVDKGLAEALMLRRATCTIYMAQESDTLGKDSELASTLAQGKPVIAYLPSVGADYIAEYFADLTATNPGKDENTLLLEQLRLFDPGSAWTDPQVREWCESPHHIDQNVLRAKVIDRIKDHYDKRAKTLKESHPLAIQVNLGTGVANGVLVVRTPHDCASLVRGIVTRTLEFDLQTTDEFTALREKISGCIFRVMTADAMLTNTFWNFYLNPAQ
jgi:hypothetical protein